MGRHWIFSIFVVLFTTLGWCQEDFFNNIAARSPLVAQFYPQDQSTLFAFGTSSLDGRSLLASWLGIRQETCVNAGYYPCADGNGCCPAGQGCCPNGCCKQSDTWNCCTNINACVPPGGACCSNGVCPSGWSCCTAGHCYPNGGECCSTGEYCTDGNVCVLVNGVQKCCTDVHCTAYVVGTVTVGGGAGAINPTQTETVLPTGAPITEAQTTSSAELTLLQYYYFTITWEYVSWYWIYETIDVGEVSTTTYTEITTTTMVSVYDSNSESASSSFLAISATLSLTTPAAASNPINTLAPNTGAASSSSPHAGGGTGFGSLPTTSSSSSSPHAGVSTSPATTSAAAGVASGSTQLKTVWAGFYAISAFVGLSMISGFLMLWL